MTWNILSNRVASAAGWLAFAFLSLVTDWTSWIGCDAKGKEYWAFLTGLMTTVVIIWGSILLKEIRDAKSSK